MDDSALIERALRTSQSCLAPVLDEDFDSQPISREDFDQFRVFCNQQLTLLLDILHQNSDLLESQAYDNQVIQLRMNLLLIASEQLAHNSFFGSDDKILLQSLQKIALDHASGFEDIIYEKTIKKFKEALSKENWKRNIGLAHGFPYFCALFFNHKPKLVNEDFLMFALAIASNFTSHHEPHYKIIGLKIFRHLVQLGDAATIRNLNIHSVIFNEAFPLIERSAEIEFNEHLYEILYRIVLIDDSIKLEPRRKLTYSKRSLMNYFLILDLTIEDTKWCKFDDIMSKLISHYETEREEKLNNFLLYQIVKFSTISYDVKLKSIEEIKGLEKEFFVEFKEKFKKVNVRMLRWIKNLMVMMTKRTNGNSLFTINCFQIIYISTICNAFKAEGVQEDFYDILQEAQ